MNPSPILAKESYPTITRVRSARTEDLRAELNRRRAGEDARVTIERARVRRLSIEGRNLEAELDVAVPKPQGLAQAPVVGVGCTVLVDHLRAVAWPSKFRPHLPEKYDGSTNPSEFLQVYIAAITTTGGNDAVMASYFHVALTGPAWTWLMNLTPGSIQSWGELCAQFTANFASAYLQHGVEAHLHAVRQQPGETLRAFISCFTKVRGTIPRISDASIITAFQQGVRDEKMLEKLATHQVETVTTLFALADKYARAAEGRAWHPVPQGGPAQTGGSSVAAPGSGKKRNKKNRGMNKPQIGVPVAAAAAWAKTRKASTHANSILTLGHVLFTRGPATAPLNAAKSRNSWSASARGATRPPRMTPPHHGGPARRRSLTLRQPRQRGS
jgi:hypothetical protein